MATFRQWVESSCMAFCFNDQGGVIPATSKGGPGHLRDALPGVAWRCETLDLLRVVPAENPPPKL